jgi:hypothetical protein
MKADKGCDPDYTIFDLHKIEKDLAKLNAIYEEHEKEITAKSVHIKKLSSQIESLLKVLEEDNENKKKDSSKMNELK